MKKLTILIAMLMASSAWVFETLSINRQGKVFIELNDLNGKAVSSLEMKMRGY